MHLQQNTPEWLEFRKNYLGASDAPVVMGISPWRTPYQLWRDKVGLGEPQTMSFAMQRGVDMEQAARDWFEKKTGIKIYPQVVLHQEIPYLMASIDGMSEDLKTVVEIKCPGKQDHLVAKNGQVPAKYYPQLQHQIEVCKIKSLYYLSFDGRDGVLLHVERDDKYIQDLLEQEQQFWECVNSLKAPELCEKDYITRDDEIWLAMAREWHIIQDKMNELKLRENELRESFNAMADGKSCMGGGIKVSHVVRRGYVDYSAIPELFGVDLEKYRKSPAEFFKITAVLPF